jgi:hypothetical protein
MTRVSVKQARESFRKALDEVEAILARSAKTLGFDCLYLR